jgi:hypothetical protein
VVRNFGNFSAHEITTKATTQIVEVEPGEAEWSIDVVEQLIEYYYVKLTEEEQKIADLNKKLVDAGKPPILQPSSAPDENGGGVPSEGRAARAPRAPDHRVPVSALSRR